MTSLCTEFWQVILAQAIGIGIGIGLLFLPTLSIISQYFFKRRATAIGLVTAGSSIGGTSIPPSFSSCDIDGPRYLPPDHAQQPDRKAWLQEGGSIHRLPRPRMPRHRTRPHAPSSPTCQAHRTEADPEADLLEQALLSSHRGTVLRRMGLVLPDLLSASESPHQTDLTHTDDSRSSLLNTASPPTSSSTHSPSSTPHPPSVSLTYPLLRTPADTCS